MPGLRIAAIHNGELDQAPARDLIDELAEQASTVTEVTEQAPFAAVPNLTELATWRRGQSELEMNWARYLQRPRSALTSLIGRIVFEAGIRISPARRSDSWRIRQVEKAVTGKHVRAWRDFLDSTDTELLVLESDAIRTEATAEILTNLLRSPSERPRYVNLAGGLDPGTLGIDQLARDPWDVDARLTAYRRPVTNTSCAYLINRPMAQLAIDHLDPFPSDVELGIDWLWNAVFLSNQSAPIECLHAQPPAIIHGSTEGLTKSWHPNR